MLAAKRWGAAAATLMLTLTWTLAARGQQSAAPAPTAPPVVHPIYAQMPDAPENDLTRRAFATAVTRYRLRPLEVVDIAPPPPSQAGSMVKMGVTNTLKLAFAAALKDLDAAAAEVASTGGAGLSTEELSELYLHRAMATARADWNAPAAVPGSAPPDDPRARAYEDYLRAATLTPARALNPRELPPQVVEDFRRAVEEVRRRPRGTLTVRGPAEAQVTVDGGAPAPLGGGLTVRDLVYGEHYVHVEEVGRAAWGTALPFGAPSLELEVPDRAALALDDATAAAHARRMGARFALLAEPKPGPGNRVELRLIDASGARRDSALVSATGEQGSIDAAVMRLDEEARRLVLVDAQSAAPPAATATAPASPPLLLAPPPARARFGDDPAAWARDHWPLLTAAGVMLTAALILSISVANDRADRPTR